ncbi:MAG: ankyrin repeat domain-containing protein [Candidatus Eremiobacteraeota bacterium]|nr:ankyrin repeat domain-containing protein [Candidatus Eremiobacteraeota bacterium]
MRLSFLILTLFFIISITPAAWGTMIIDNRYACPLCGIKDYYGDVASFGSYIYSGLSRFQVVFYPYTEPDCLYACQKCHFTCLIDDFKRKIPKESAADMKMVLAGTDLPPPEGSRNDYFRKATYYMIPMTSRLFIAERVYRALKSSDETNCHFYLMAAYHYDRAGLTEQTTQSRKQALGYAERLIADPKYKDRLKEFYLISGAMRFFLHDNEKARRDFEKGRTASFKNKMLTPEQSKESEEYLNDLLDQYLDYQPGEIEMLLAVDSGGLRKAKELLDKYPELVKKCFHRGPPNERATFLHFAVKDGNFEMAKLLIARGADVNGKDERGSTPLFWARPKHPSVLFHGVMQLLISRGAEINAVNDAGYTPLHCAVLEGDTDIVKLLLYWGADGSIKDKRGNTPLMYAKKKGFGTIVELLQSRQLKQ